MALLTQGENSDENKMDESQWQSQILNEGPVRFYQCEHGRGKRIGVNTQCVTQKTK